MRRNYDGHIIHANVDTDVMVGEEPPYGATASRPSCTRSSSTLRRGAAASSSSARTTTPAARLTLGRLSGSNHEAAAWARHFDGTVESFNAEGEPPTLLPNHLNGTTPQIEIRPNRRRGWGVHQTRRARGEGARGEGEPPLPMPEMPRFVEQHPFNMG